MTCRQLIIIFFCILLSAALYGQQDSVVADPINKQRLRNTVLAVGAGYTATLVALNELWYKDTPRGAFHFFNDNAEWKQMDKAGHFYSAFYLSYGGAMLLKDCGVDQRKSHFYGALTGFMLMLPIEIMDAYSPAYGASAGDLMANAAGAAFYLGQSLLWDKPKLMPKFSFQRSDYASLRPEVLGDHFAAEILKDYNGQTYWLSADMDRFLPFPKWLNLAIGYGASGMVYARDDVNREAGYNAYRQYYFSLDPDLSAIRTRSKVVKAMLFVAGMIKIPSPTVSFSSAGTKWYWLY